MWYIPYSGILRSNKKGTVDICISIDKPPKIMLSVDTKDYILHYFIYMKFLLKAKLQRQKVDWWLPGVRGKVETDGRWAQGNFLGWWKCSKTVLWSYFVTVALEIHYSGLWSQRDLGYEQSSGTGVGKGAMVLTVSVSEVSGNRREQRSNQSAGISCHFPSPQFSSLVAIFFWPDRKRTTKITLFPFICSHIISRRLKLSFPRCAFNT